MKNHEVVDALSLLSLIEKVTVRAERGACFNGTITSQGGYSQDVLRDVLKKISAHSTPACLIGVYMTQKKHTYMDVAHDLPGIGKDVQRVDQLGEWLISMKYALAVPQVFSIFRSTRYAEDVGPLADNGGRNFFLETGNAKEPVSVVSVLKREKENGWGLHLDSLDNPFACSRPTAFFIRENHKQIVA